MGFSYTTGTYKPGDPNACPSNGYDEAAGSHNRRVKQWQYLAPVAASPFVHIVVSSYRKAKSPLAKRLMLFGGVIGGTVATVGMRLVLMADAGYPGAEEIHTDKGSRGMDFDSAAKEEWKIALNSWRSLI
jgi:hypothetical protein